MLLLSALFFGVALCLFLLPHLRQQQSKFKNLEQEWLSSMKKGMAQEFMFIDPLRLRVKLRWIALIGLGISIATFSLLPFLVSLLAAWLIPFFALKLIQRRRRTLFKQQFSQALPQISSILKAGHPFERALESLSETAPNPLRQELGLVLKELKLGHSLNQALDNLLKRFPNRDLEIVIRAVQISKRVGSNLGEVFDRVAETVRNRSILMDRLSTLTTQGRAQAWIAMLMPVLMIIPLQLFAPGYLTPLLDTRVGHFVIGLCLVMLTIGGIWIHRISKMELMK